MTTPLLLAFDLTDRPVLAVGGGPVTARRVTSLRAAGAVIRVIAPRLCPELADLALRREVDWVPRAYAGPEDLAGMWLVHTATGNPPVDAAVARDAEHLRLPCVDASGARDGSVHVPAQDSVPTPDGTVSVAVRTGNDPRLAATIRDRLVDRVRHGLVDLRRRRPGRPGRVSLVGAGPGDVGLVTSRARTLLACADVVVTDRLVPAELVEDLPADVLVIDVGKSPGHHPVPQERINGLLVEHARAGRSVVRFKGGDPYLLGRGGEERAACERQGIPVDVVPGVSSALAVPAAAGIPVTHRGLSRAVTVLSGHRPPPGLPVGDDHTVVLLMGVAGFATTATELLLMGRSPDCPVAFIESGCTPRQRVITARLGSAVEVARSRRVASPAVIVLGSVVTLSPFWTWNSGRAGEASPAAVEPSVAVAT
jgi:uroporphyrin-III C-methyltransferase/precorrin-2 dehydrogenase/sirohydrochlorin ferrochelatase